MGMGWDWTAMLKICLTIGFIIRKNKWSHLSQHERHSYQKRGIIQFYANKIWIIIWWRKTKAWRNLSLFNRAVQIDVTCDWLDIELKPNLNASVCICCMNTRIHWKLLVTSFHQPRSILIIILMTCQCLPIQ